MADTPTLTALNGAAATISFGAIEGLVADTSHTALSITGANLASGSESDGTLTLDTADQELVFTPAAGFTGSAVADVTVTDGDGVSVVQPIDLTSLVQASSPTPTFPTHTGGFAGGAHAGSETFSFFGVLLGYTVINSKSVSPGTTKTTTLNFDAENNQTGATIVTVSGDKTITQDFTGSDFSDQTSATIVTVNENVTTTETYDGSWNRTGGTIVTVDGDQTITQNFTGSDWTQTSATIVKVSGGVTTTETFDGDWNQTGGTIVTIDGDQTITQNFVGSGWTMANATIVKVDAGVTTTETFDGNWSQTGGTIVTVDGDQTTTQYFTGHWTLTGATIVTVNGDQTTTMNVDANWHTTSATIVTASGDKTDTQTFDGNWNQTGATIVVVNGAQTITQTYGASFSDFLGGTTDVTFSSGLLASQFTTYDSNGSTLSQADTDSNGVVRYFTYGQAGGDQTLASAADHSQTYVFTPGTLNGDTLSGLHTLNLGGGVHDVIDLVGYGPGAALVQLSATEWEVTSTNNPAETFTLAGGATLAAGDYGFTASAPSKVGTPSASVSIDAVGGDGFINAAETRSGLVLTGSAFDALPSQVVGQPVQVALNGYVYTTTVDADGSWSVDVGAANLANLYDSTTYQLQASVTDVDDVTASATETLTVDRLAFLGIRPVGEEIDDVVGASDLASGFTISGASGGSGETNGLHLVDFAGQDITVTLNGASYTAVAGTTGDWSVTLSASQAATLENGQAYTVTASGTDDAGNSAAYSTVVLVDAAGTPFAGNVRSASGAGTLTADAAHDTLEGSASGGDAFVGTAANLTGTTLVNFGQAGDTLDVTDVSGGASAAVTFTEDPSSNAFGTLTIGTGAHAASVILFGQYMASHFQAASDGGGGTLITYTAPAPPVIAAHG